MIKKAVQKVLCEQIRYEMESGYLYLAMAADFHAKGLDGMAQWMRAQAREELGHAMRFFDHVHQRGGRVSLEALAEPKKDWASPLEAFQAAYEHERMITGRIDALVETARKETDNAALLMLQWFVGEQVEEEASVKTIVDRLSRIGDSGHGLVMLDRELGARGAS
ncbi:MAG: ferritin [Candidatus Bipolaricaulis sp.]|nr:ferritin [Candidatus Bipolaricaulis sp.]MDD5646307.1 ferritin [Candidatus Bipolaricaulis sp.]